MSNNPFNHLASIFEKRINDKANQALIGVPCTLGTMSSTGVKLDDFNHEIQDPLYADWEFKMEVPATSRVVTLASPVQPSGSDIPVVTSYSSLTRIDFTVQGVGDPSATTKVHMDLKSNLKSGDRVLCVPINGGNDVVIICKVVS